MNQAKNKQKNVSSSKCEAATLFPREIVEQILGRLPAKTLCRFRCVSKSWLSTICSPQFAKTHFNLDLEDKTLYSQRLKLLLTKHTFYSVEWESVTPDNGIVAVEIEHPVRYDDVKHRRLPNVESDCPVVKLDFDYEELVKDVWGSCKGLVLVGTEVDTVFLFNPFTRESKRIPPNPARCPISVNAYGFGYDSVSDDYKMVMIDVGVVSMYSLREDSWRIVRDSQDNYFMDYGVFHNGAIHWANSEVVASFDLAEEVLRTSFSFRSMNPICKAINGDHLLSVDGKFILYNLETNTHLDLE
ncbi:hypothetical protein Tsubulata_019023, partial [Turnera subulata]